MPVPTDRDRIRRPARPCPPPGAARADRPPCRLHGPRRAPAGLAALFAVALVAGCGGAARTDRTGDVRLVNATAGGAALDLYAGETRIAAAVPAAAASGYAEVETGPRSLSLRLPAGGAQLARASADIARDARHTLLAYTAAGGAVAAIVLGDEEAAPADGNAKVRVLNAASADAGALSAYLVPGGCTGLGAANAIATGATAAAPGAYATVGAAGAGTAYHLCVTGADPSDLRLAVSPFVLASRQVKTVVLTTTPGGVLVDALAVEQRGGVTALRNPRARMRLVADAAGRARVAASVNGTILTVDAGSPGIGAYQQVNAGPLAADVRIGGAAVAVPALGVPGGADLTLLVAGSAAVPTVALLADDNRLSAAGGATMRLRLVHGVNGLADALSLSADLFPVASGVAFATASPPVAVPDLAGASLQVASAAGGVPLYDIVLPTTLRAGFYSLFMLGDAAQPVGMLRLDRPAAPAASAASGATAGASAAR